MTVMGTKREPSVGEDSRVAATPPTASGVLSTQDGEILTTLHLSRIEAVTETSCDHSIGAGEIGVVFLPGFSGSSGKLVVREVAERLRPFAGVLVVDLRGHGHSSGMCTFGDREVLDADAAVGAARDLGYRRVVTVGWSMGASTALRHAALAGRGRVHGFAVRNPVDAVVSVSAPSRWFVRDTAPMRRLEWLAATAGGRAVARRALKVRISPDGWPEIPAAPVEVVGDIAPTPLLVVHGDEDSYFTLDHPRALAAAAGRPSEVWIVPGFGHAEAGVTDVLVERIGRHLPDLLDGCAERSHTDTGAR
jgi:pimeloyl-ACP methyl ester carboxylesterase